MDADAGPNPSIVTKMNNSSRITPFAAIVGLALGIATLDAQHLSIISDNPVFGVFQEALVFVLVPGLILAAFGGSLWIGFFVNTVFYFGFAWIVGKLWQRFHPKPRALDPPSADPLS